MTVPDLDEAAYVCHGYFLVFAMDISKGPAKQPFHSMAEA